MTIARPGTRGMDGTLRRLFAGGTCSGLSDAELLGRFAADRDEAAFEALVRRHGPAVWAACRAVLRDAHDAEDAFQATFLVLSRRAPALRAEGGSLGAWLYTVAHRAAARVIADASRRRARERRAAVRDAIPPAEAADDLRAAIHREIARLPERHRRAVVLCDLEGRTQAEAAAELSRGEATVRRRLAEARALLRSRLERRGLAPAAGAFALLRAGRAGAAAIPEPLASAAVRAACGLPSRLASKATAAALASRVARGMLLARLAVASIVATVALAGVGAAVVALGGNGRPPEEVAPPPVAQSTPPAPAPAPAPIPAPQPDPPPSDPTDPVPVAGLVVDPEGDPVAGASVVLRVIDDSPGPGRGTDRVRVARQGEAGADGRFRFEAPTWQAGDDVPDPMRPRAYLAAFADGFGVAWISDFAPDEAGDLTLRLVPDDVPIEGRVLDLEGRPIVGARVAVEGLHASSDGRLDAYLQHLPTVLDNRDGAWTGLDAYLPLPGGFELLAPAATTDADGRFRLLGVGRERVASVKFHGPTIAFSGNSVFARTRPGPTHRFPGDRSRAELGNFVIHGSVFEHVATPMRPIEGIVRDADTGAPIPGVTIVSDRFAGSIISGLRGVRAVTTAEGRYRLLGMPPGEGNAIDAEPGPDLPYLGRIRGVPGGSAAEPARVDFELRRGVHIRGRVTDASTGRPVAARVEYFAFSDNPHLEGLRDLASEPVYPDEDGSFAVVGLPGRGLIAVRDELDRYAISQGIDAISGLGDGGDELSFSTEPYICDAKFFHTIAEVDPPADADSIRCDLQLNPGRSVSGTVVGPDGEPIAGGVEVTGIRAWTMVWANGAGRLDSAEFTVEALDPDRPRRLTFRHADRDLMASLIVRGDEPGPLTVRLEPAAAVTGRLLDDLGRPVNRVRIHAGVVDFGPVRSWVDRFVTSEIDADGRFRVSGLVPGLPFGLSVWSGKRHSSRIAEDLVLEPGESRDLGELTIGEGD